MRRMIGRPRRLFSILALLLALPYQAEAKEKREGGAQSKRLASPILLDRAVVRFTAPEGGGRERPYFIYERELAFEARLVALADVAHRGKSGAYRRHHLQNALERHIAETLLAALPVDPPQSPTQISRQVQVARKMIVGEVGGEEAFMRAARLEGIGRLEVRRFVRRRALASLYLHIMVAPMLTPSSLELRKVHRSGKGPLAHRAFAEAQPALIRWVVARHLRTALTVYFQNARARVRLKFL